MLITDRVALTDVSTSLPLEDEDGLQVQSQQSIASSPRSERPLDRGPVAESGQLAAGLQDRPRVRGKFLFAGEEKFYVRGVTYGTFRPDDEGDEFPPPEVVERDFSEMA